VEPQLEKLHEYQNATRVGFRLCLNKTKVTDFEKGKTCGIVWHTMRHCWL